MSQTVHFTKIETADASGLGGLQLVGEASCRFSSTPVFTEIKVNGLVGVTVEDELENNQRVFTTTATFESCDKEPLAARRHVFRLTGADGKQYLIGTDTRPFPIIKEKNPWPAKPTESTMKTVTVMWKALLPILTIVT